MRTWLLALLGASCLAACSDSATGTDAGATPDGATAPDGATTDSAAPRPEAGGPDTGTPPLPADANRPPTGRADIEKWLAEGHYKSWKCEPDRHPPRAGSGHSTNRICSNPILSAHPDGAGEFPVDSAAVKELYDGMGNINGYAVYRHVRAGGDGAAWYWYERIGASVVADGTGDTGSAKSICHSCHEGAGKGGQTGHDFVFTQIR